MLYGASVANSVQAAASVLGVSVDELFDIFSAERPADRAYVNVGLDDIAGPRSSRSDQPLAPGDAVLLWVEIGPRSPNAVAGDVEPIDPELLAVGQELEVVLFTDAGLSLRAGARCGAGGRGGNRVVPGRQWDAPHPWGFGFAP